MGATGFANAGRHAAVVHFANTQLKSSVNCGGFTDRKVGFQVGQRQCPGEGFTKLIPIIVAGQAGEQTKLRAF